MYGVYNKIPSWVIPLKLAPRIWGYAWFLMELVTLDFWHPDRWDINIAFIFIALIIYNPLVFSFFFAQYFDEININE